MQAQPLGIQRLLLKEAQICAVTLFPYIAVVAVNVQIHILPLMFAVPLIQLALILAIPQLLLLTHAQAVEHTMQELAFVKYQLHILAIPAMLLLQPTTATQATQQPILHR